MVEKDMEQLGEWIADCLVNHDDEAKIKSIRADVEAFCESFGSRSILGL